MIVRYAAEMDIPPERVHFIESVQVEGVPLPLRTGDPVYRDSGGIEIDPPSALTTPPSVVTATPFISSIPRLPNAGHASAQ